MNPCHLQSGTEGVALGAARYFRDIFIEVVDKMEAQQFDPIELHSDWLCHVPEAAQPLLVATAEHLLYLVLDVIPSMVGRFS